MGPHTRQDIEVVLDEESKFRYSLHNRGVESVLRGPSTCEHGLVH